MLIRKVILRKPPVTLKNKAPEHEAFARKLEEEQVLNGKPLRLDACHKHGNLRPER